MYTVVSIPLELVVSIPLELKVSIYNRINPLFIHVPMRQINYVLSILVFTEPQLYICNVNTLPLLTNVALEQYIYTAYMCLVLILVLSQPCKIH